MGGENSMETHNGIIKEQKSADDEIWIRHGDEMLNKGQAAKALDYYERALGTTSSLTQAHAWHGKANALDSMGKLADAIECYDNALACDPQDAECWFNKGLTLKKLGREEEGASCINKGVHISMGH